MSWNVSHGEFSKKIAGTGVFKRGGGAGGERDRLYKWERVKDTQSNILSGLLL